MNDTPSSVLKNIIRSTFGLIVFAIGVSFTIEANIGLSPWECLSMGISNYVPLSYGLVHSITGAIIIVIDLLLKEKIGYGTIFDVLLVGTCVDIVRSLHIIPTSDSLIYNIVLLFIAMTIIALGQYFYISAGLGCGPRDTLRLALGKRFPKVPIGAVQTALFLFVLIIGFVLGGPIGLGTIILVFGCGSVMQVVFNLLHFEPRDITHQNFIRTTMQLFSCSKVHSN